MCVYQGYAKTPMKSFEIGSKLTQVFFLHGLRGHGLAQHAALQHMVKNLGVNMISLELDGHGAESSRRHCLVPPFKQIVDDICAEIHRQSIDAEQIILMGYSFGGALMVLAANQLMQDDEFSPKVRGFIGVSTAFDVGHNVPRWQLGLVNAVGPVSRFLFEKAWRLSRLLTIQEMDIDLISPDKTVTSALENDPLVYKGRIPLATSAQVYHAGIAAKQVMKQFSLDTLLVHSRDDKIALSPTKTTFGEHVQLRLFNKLRHNCIDGISREVVVSRKTITQFIVARL